MKKPLLVTALMLITIFTYAQDKKPLISFHSSTNCYDCGTWGLEFFKRLKKEFDSSAVVLNIQSDGELSNPLSQGIANNFGTDIPAFYFNEQKIDVNEFNVDLKFDEIITKVDSFKIAHPYTVEFTVEEDQNNFFLILNSELIPDSTYVIGKEMRYGFYFIQNHVEFIQSGAGDIFHDRIFLAWDIDPFGSVFKEVGKILNEGWLYNSTLAGVDVSGNGGNVSFDNSKWPLFIGKIMMGFISLFKRTFYP